VQINAATSKVVFATYKRQQTMLERQRRCNFLAEMQLQATTECDNSIVGPSKKTWGLGGDDLKTTNNATKAT